MPKPSEVSVIGENYKSAAICFIDRMVIIVKHGKMMLYEKYRFFFFFPSFFLFSFVVSF